MTKRGKLLLVGNWKMNLGPAAAHEIASQLAGYPFNHDEVEVWITPPATSIPVALQAVSERPVVKVGSQNVHWAASGAFTGEISPSFLKELGCSFAIVGHSERRAIFGESDEMVAKRMSGSLSAGLDTILCIGETAEERETGATNDVISKQLGSAFSALPEVLTSRLVVAYEPVWAIGTGKVASNEDIVDAHSLIRELCKSRLPDTEVAILYGGSVNPDNFGTISKLENVDGALVGGASIKFDQFARLIDICKADG